MQIVVKNARPNHAFMEHLRENEVWKNGWVDMADLPSPINGFSQVQKFIGHISLLSTVGHAISHEIATRVPVFAFHAFLHERSSRIMVESISIGTFLDAKHLISESFLCNGSPR